MKKALTVSLLALLISQGAAAAEYTLNNASMALSFNDADSSAKVKDEKSAHQLSPQELFFLTLPDETIIHTADFKIKHVEKHNDSIVVDYTRPDFNVTVKMNLIKGNYASIDYTIAAVGQSR
ncbi:enterotoxin, partial [Klebsiella aerogenes]